MAPVFGILSLISSGLLVTALVMGAMGTANHLMWGLAAAVLAVSIHCLIFGIFTGSGKDTRLLVQDLHLDPDYVKRTKIYKKTIFPPALYAIFFLVVTTTLGGAFSSKGMVWLGWIHGLVASFSVYYNLKTFLLEYRAVKENGQIIKNLNSSAGSVLSGTPAPKTEFTVEDPNEKVAELDWGTHVFAFGKFLCFLGWNVWLVFIYFRFIMGEYRLSIWPFVASSVFLYGIGYFLRLRYSAFKPTFSPS